MSDDLGSSSYMNISEASTSQPSIIDVPTTPPIESGRLDDLPSEPDSDESTTSEDEGESDAEREWKESMQQLELLLSMVLVPYLGKYFGRKFAYWGWKQFMEWKYPVEIVFTNKTAFKAVGAIEAAASLHNKKKDRASPERSRVRAQKRRFQEPHTSEPAITDRPSLLPPKDPLPTTRDCRIETGNINEKHERMLEK